jgi:hypothetical protein
MSGGKLVEREDVREFLASPRHAHYFRTNGTVQETIARRRDELLKTGRLPGKTPIVNFQTAEQFAELHDGNTSGVAWLLYAEAAGIATTLGDFRRAFDQVIVLTNRRHENGELWHPYLPPDLYCADRLQTVFDHEQLRVVRKAVTLTGEPVLFDNESFFSGVDKSERVGDIARLLKTCLAP